MHVVAGRSLPLRIVENDRARRLTLRIDSGGRGLRITVPPGLARARGGAVPQPPPGLAGAAAGQGARAGRRCGPASRLPLRGVPHRIVHEPETRGTVTCRRDDATGRC